MAGGESEDGDVLQTPVTSIIDRVIKGARALFGFSGDEDNTPLRDKPNTLNSGGYASFDEETSETLVGVFVGWEEDLIIQEAYRIGAGLPSRIPASSVVTREEAEAAEEAAEANFRQLHTREH